MGWWSTGYADAARSIAPLPEEFSTAYRDRIEAALIPPVGPAIATYALPTYNRGWTFHFGWR